MTRTLALTVAAAMSVGAGTLGRASIACAQPCSDDDVNRILAPPRGDDDAAIIDCELELSPLQAAAIRRRLLFIGSESSGATLDCHGGAIGSADAPQRVLIASRRIGSSSIPGVGLWEPVTDVTIRDCEVRGRVHIQGMGVGDWDDEVTLSSHVPIGHVARVREAAPRRITLDGVTLVAVGRPPLYVSIGVEEATLVRSYVTGWSSSIAIYIDAESRRTTIRDSMIDTVTPRELLAIDGSEENRIIGNWFSRLDHGGIYLFRNCGERRTVRFTTPRHNEIINNVFYYERYDGPNPAVFLGSDNGFSTHRFCHHDLDYPFGSGADDRDFVMRNAVMQNQIYRRSADEMIHTEWRDWNGPNYVELNTTVTSAVSRPSGCFVDEAGAPRLLLHGASTTLARDRDARPYEGLVEVTCVDGELAYASIPSLRLPREVPFSCSVSGGNQGCSGHIVCPDGSALVGAHAACNLEYGPVSDAQLASVPRDTLRVVRVSDLALQGRCWLGAEGLAAGEVPLAGALGRSAGDFGCREHDQNGGDCEIRGVAYCVDP